MHFEQTATLRMSMNACGHHTKSPQTNKQSSFDNLSLGNAFITIINPFTAGFLMGIEKNCMLLKPGVRRLQAGVHLVS